MPDARGQVILYQVSTHYPGPWIDKPRAVGISAGSPCGLVVREETGQGFYHSAGAVHRRLTITEGWSCG